MKLVRAGLVPLVLVTGGVIIGVVVASNMGWLPTLRLRQVRIGIVAGRQIGGAQPIVVEGTVTPSVLSHHSPPSLVPRAGQPCRARRDCVPSDTANRMPA